MAEPIDFIDALRKMMDSRLYEVNTSLPATIVSYSNGRATVQPTPKRRFADGDVLDFPILQNVRVCWPAFAGGAAGVKGPVLAGDKCLIVFAQQAVDGTDDARRFDISDSYAVMCDLGAAGGGDSANNDAMTLFYGSAHVRITQGGKVVINAPAGLDIAGYVTAPDGARIAGRDFVGHTHGGVQAGGGNTGGVS